MPAAVSYTHLDVYKRQIQDGETILLCGESGCGKTTLTRLINGLIPHYYGGKLTGQVLLDGKELKDYPLYQIGQRVGSVFQNPRTQFYNVDTVSYTHLDVYKRQELRQKPAR